MTILDEHGAPTGNGDGERWRILRTIIVVVSMGSAVFFAGMSWSKVAATTDRIQEFDDTYVRKDGRELAEINGRLLLLDQKIDLLLRERGIR